MPLKVFKCTSLYRDCVPQNLEEAPVLMRRPAQLSPHCLNRTIKMCSSGVLYTFYVRQVSLQLNDYQYSIVWSKYLKGQTQPALSILLSSLREQAAIVYLVSCWASPEQDESQIALDFLVICSWSEKAEIWDSSRSFEASVGPYLTAIKVPAMMLAHKSRPKQETARFSNEGTRHLCREIVKKHCMFTICVHRMPFDSKTSHLHNCLVDSPSYLWICHQEASSDWQTPLLISQSLSNYSL